MSDSDDGFVGKVVAFAAPARVVDSRFVGAPQAVVPAAGDIPVELEEVPDDAA